MKSSVKIIIVFGIIILLLAVAVVILRMTDSGADDGSGEVPAVTEPSSKLIYDKDPADISMVTVKNGSGSYSIERIGENDVFIWTILDLERVQAPVDYNALNSTLENSASMTIQQLVAENAPDISIYGLENPRAEVKIEFTDDGSTVKEILIGDETPSAGRTYFCFKGENTVYTANNADTSCFLEDTYFYVNKTLYTAFTPADPEDTTDYTRINKLTVNRTDIDYDIVIEYDKRQDNPDIVIGNSSQHRLASPVVLDLNSETSADVMQSVFGLTADSVEMLAPLSEDLEKYGLRVPYAQISMDISGGDFKMSVGNETEDKTGRYCVAQDINAVYVLSNDKLPWLKVMPLDLTTSLITSNYIYSLTNVDITGTGIDAHFTVTGSSADDFAVKLNGNDTDTEAFKTFYQYILKAPAEELYLDSVNTEPYLTVSIKTAGYSDVLEFVDIGNRRSVIVLNGRPSFSCRTSYAERLIENYNSYKSGGEIIDTW